jgi:hypothetical protein
LAFRRTARSRSLSPDARGVQEGYRSGLEKQEQERLKQLGVPYDYEPFRIEYYVEETKHYTPDFLLLQNGIFVETKGRFTTADRKKHKLIKAQHPQLDLRFVFSNSRARISKQSKTTYAAWCLTHGFKFADKTIPMEWINEAVNAKSLWLAQAWAHKREEK